MYFPFLSETARTAFFPSFPSFSSVFTKQFADPLFLSPKGGEGGFAIFARKKRRKRSSRFSSFSPFLCTLSGGGAREEGGKEERIAKKSFCFGGKKIRFPRKLCYTKISELDFSLNPAPMQRHADCLSQPRPGGGGLRRRRLLPFPPSFWDGGRGKRKASLA